MSQTESSNGGNSGKSTPKSTNLSSTTAATSEAAVVHDVVVDHHHHVEGEGEEDDMLLVTEFPPPPYYYTLASTHPDQLKPPEIPYKAFRVAAKKVMAERRRAKEESERIRLLAEGSGGDHAVKDAGKDGNKDASGKDVSGKADPVDAPDSKSEDAPGSSSSAVSSSATPMDEDEDDDIDINDPNAPVVAVFGEIVEDPTLVQEEECEDPLVIRENVKQLNQSVLRGFLKLVQKLVKDPNDNKKLRDELSHNIFLMLQECNKFREHQAREILISTLEEQLKRRKEGLELIKRQIREADDALEALMQFRAKQ